MGWGRGVARGLASALSGFVDDRNKQKKNKALIDAMETGDYSSVMNTPGVDFSDLLKIKELSIKDKDNTVDSEKKVVELASAIKESVRKQIEDKARETASAYGQEAPLQQNRMSELSQTLAKYPVGQVPKLGTAKIPQVQESVNKFKQAYEQNRGATSPYLTATQAMPRYDEIGGGQKIYYVDPTGQITVDAETGKRVAVLPPNAKTITKPAPNIYSMFPGIVSGQATAENSTDSGLSGTVNVYDSTGNVIGDMPNDPVKIKQLLDRHPDYRVE
jgi:hypothetical protein